MREIDTSEFSRLLGLRYFGSGNHGDHSVVYAWAVQVQPSFDPGLTLGVAATRSHSSRDAPPAIRCVFATDAGESGKAILMEDPVAAALSRVDLCALHPHPVVLHGRESMSACAKRGRVVARDSALVLIEPSGRELRMEPIGPSLFEFDYVAPAGVIIRMAFARDASGRVASANRLIPGNVTTFVRMR